MAVFSRKKAAVAGIAVTAVAASLMLSGCATSDSSNPNFADCKEVTDITWLGTIKVEIQDQFTNAIDTYNATNTDCTTVTIVESPDQPFLQTVTTMYEAGEAPTIMTALQELPDMADKVMDWTGQPLAELAAPGTLDVANIDGKQVGIPVTAEAFGLLYNKAVLDAAGVDPAAIKTRSDLANAFAAVEATGVSPMHFSGLWWSLGAHLTNVYHANAAETAEGQLAVLDELTAGGKSLMDDPAFINWLDTFDLLKANTIDTATIADSDYDVAVENLATGQTAFWFMGNWAEPNLLTTTPDGEFGIMPLPINDNAGSAANENISVGVPFYIMIDTEQSTEAQQKSAIAVLTWFLTTPEGQAFWAGPVEKDGMNFIPVYEGFEVEPATYMAQEIAKYIAAGKTLQWVNSAYPAGLQDAYGAAAQKYYDGQIDRAAFAAELEAAWKK
ncbi:ABC transporter substrate-binding protein [Aurantimicrobium sp. MWH-Uga1]|uniref:ABC transporter substrate-binding protein n=1 Tax=Aurantimicrobium sp. MWH-Uga1 TaxID=2079575 RepID=UPI000DED3E0C|nr:extracellular solute-binding protein [Aurantimicrobium sp. MWH-Uga1]AXE54725.1 maltose ABC transporter periplasmic protein [Aurantimicrobium sp. MWH-Uga1]